MNRKTKSACAANEARTERMEIRFYDQIERARFDKRFGNDDGRKFASWLDAFLSRS